jgi:hypothetical protein
MVTAAMPRNGKATSATSRIRTLNLPVMFIC